MYRRDLLRWAALGTALPGWARAIPMPTPGATKPGSVVLVELKGGNDGLNTLVPYTDPDYARLRPRLAIAPDLVLPLDGRIGLHPSLRPLMASWDAGELAWVQGVGYAEPNRSHFRSIAIWNTASDSDEVLNEGWLTRLMPIRARGALPDVVVLAGDDGPAYGGALHVVSLQTPEQFATDAALLKAQRRSPDTTPALAHILAVRASIRRAGVELLQATARLDALPVPFPKSVLGRQLHQVARMLIADMPIPVFKVQIGSFDTHVNQLNRHERLLAQLAEALTAFRQALLDAGCWDRVLLLSYSEFGRRVAENASAGTDHGAAAPHFALGGRVKGGLYGAPPNLTTLERGDLRYTVDYRQLYSTLAQRWWGGSSVHWQERFPAMAWL